jgi:stage II sporulation protein AA (anti-sigma F factor antagonist)
MQIETSDTGDGTAKVTLTGKLDIIGAGAVALPLATLAGAKQYMIIDMSGVTFLASIGIRQLVLAAKVLSRRNGGLVLLNPIPAVVEVLTASGLTDILPIAYSESEAMASLRRPYPSTQAGPAA